MNNIILDFWKSSLRSDFSKFNWDEAFDTFEPFLAKNVIAHGLGTYEEFKAYYDDMYDLSSMECDIPDWAKYQNDWGWFSDVDACDALLKAKYEFMSENFKHNVHGDLADLLLRLRHRSKLNESELISLFDECIHAEHATGCILEDVDIDDLRDEAETEYAEEKEEKDRFPTNIRDFLLVK